ncbi:group III truncated hemoglobin [Belliella kenyensis]|uniref:Group III truncated hemoglobin n=1 Tax=Belliella kenyensis TaxID=1472724 RepID=A0ABV8EH20_9BACT|nr:group III truncated hemoglobin [Belliella kenyensis]MCH7402449.1 group III truncated hemoglobin [Belliella kenyensis]MDN3603640.1 group III truncated hemoglobin [Belliella kenyensis]
MKEIEGRKEVSILVRSFYEKVRRDELLGPIFNGIVEDWEMHLERLTDFWEMVLLHSGPGAGKFNPVPVHKEVDRHTGSEIDQNHFEHWLSLWEVTLQEHFEGEVAEFARAHAHKMAHILFFKIMEGRSALGHQ